MPSATGDTSTTLLRAEHQRILRVAGVLETLVGRWADGGAADFDALADCVSFVRLFADACHHGKEEDLLFPALEEEGLPHDEGPIAVMLYEHRQGRAFAGEMADTLGPARDGDAGAGERFRHAALGYVGLIRAHIGKEDNVLFGMADQMVRGTACERLCAEYGVVCARIFGGRTRDELEALADSLEQRVGS